MFRTFTAVMPAPQLVQQHPADLIALLELVWDSRLDNPALDLGHPGRRSDVPGFGGTWFGAGAFAAAPPPALAPLVASIRRKKGQLTWDHLIYAYMIENTRVHDIFRRVIQELLYGEKLGVLGLRTSSQGHQWLRTTEELFFRAPSPFFIGAMDGHVRPDAAAARRNIYQRMFGMDLNHGRDDNQPYPYVKAEAANNEFATTFEELLREVWVGMINVSNTSGSRATDDARIAELAEKLFDMLRSRRQNGNLSREEFVIVSMMSWFHLSVDVELPIIEDLRAQAASADQRLFKVAQRVGLPAHGLSKNYFEIAEPISQILLVIESGILNGRAAAPLFYTPGSLLEPLMRTIITNWSTITGRDVKARKVTPS
jgi:hypothetical protein